jgi:anti-anti-sigma factor
MDIIKRVENGQYNIQLVGKFTFADNQAFRQVINEIAPTAIKQIVFDMQRLEFVDSAALGMLLLAHDESLKHKKGPIILQNPDGQVRKMFSIARFDQYFQIT